MYIELEVCMRGGVFVISDLEVMKYLGYEGGEHTYNISIGGPGIYKIKTVLVQEGRDIFDEERLLRSSGNIVVGDLYPTLGSSYYTLENYFIDNFPRSGKRHEVLNAIGIHTTKEGPYKVYIDTAIVADSATYNESYVRSALGVRTKLTL